MNALDAAIEYFGGISKLAEVIGVAPAVVGNWKMRESVPASRCLAIEAATGGAVTRYELRSDIFGPAPDKREAA